jgi:hypothetical protein
VYQRRDNIRPGVRAIRAPMRVQALTSDWLSLTIRAAEKE